MERTNKPKLNIQNKLKNLRALFNKYSISAYIIPSTDEFSLEYTAPSSKRLEYITNFTGSNGITIITKNKGYFFTDGRYIEQANKELDNEYFQIIDLKILRKFCNEKLQNEIIGLNPMLFNNYQINLFNNLNIIEINRDLIDIIWQDKPAFPNTQIYKYHEKYSGLLPIDKIKLLKQILINNEAKHYIITSPEDICWLLNIRASDVEFTPILLAYAILDISPKLKLKLFINNNSIYNLNLNLEDILSIHKLDEISFHIKNIKNNTIIDLYNSPIGISRLLYQDLIINISPAQEIKALKTNQEIIGFTDIHLIDAIAISNLLYSLNEDHKINNIIDELELSNRLHNFRQKSNLFISDSFASICGYNSNSSIIHYRPKKQSAKKIQKDGILLIDSGGHYFGGTTDVTRTINIGTPNKEHIYYYTLVLMGHIDLSIAKFQKGTKGCNLDILARKYLWQEGKDYPHGTGHGVGNALSVHEGPQRIDQLNGVVLKEGMILSIEPGYYLEGKFGIRIENLVYVKKSQHKDFLEFETLTMIPYAQELIDHKMLNKQHVQFIKDYYKKIELKLLPKLDNNTKNYIFNEMNKLIKLLI